MKGSTPEQAYLATPKATPAGTPRDEHYRIRLDHIDQFGKLTLRRAGRLHHLGVGIAHAHEPVLMIIDAHHVTVTHRTTAEILGEYDIDPQHNYWRNKTRDPGRWPGSQR